MDNRREIIQKFANIGQQQQQELMARQAEIRNAHDHLIQNSHYILEAQVLFFF